MEVTLYRLHAAYRRKTKHNRVCEFETCKLKTEVTSFYNVVQGDSWLRPHLGTEEVISN